MNRSEYDTVHAHSAPEPEEPKLTAQEFAGSGDRTLLYGYTVERYTHHVYLKDGKLHVYIYRGVPKPEEDKLVSFISGRTIYASDTVPSKRAYPQYSDAAFCHRLISLGLDPRLTSWPLDPAPDRGAFAGEVL